MLYMYHRYKGGATRPGKGKEAMRSDLCVLEVGGIRQPNNDSSKDVTIGQLG